MAGKIVAWFDRSTSWVALPAVLLLTGLSGLTVWRCPGSTWASVAIVIGIASFLDLLLFVLAWVAGATRSAARAMAAEMTASLRASEAEARKLAMVAHRTHGSVTITDQQGRIEWVNEAFTRLTGYRLEEVLGKRPGEFLQGPETDPAAIAELRRKVHDGRPFTGEIVNYSKSGRKYWSAIEVQPIADAAGRIANFISIESDVTQRKLAQQELRQREAQYRGIFEATTDALLIFDTDGTVVEANPAACAMYGYAHDEIVGLPGTGLVGRDSAHLYAEFLERVRAGERFFTEANGIRRDGTAFAVEIRGSLLSFRGRPHLLAVVGDVTERNMAQQSLREYAQALEAANRRLEEYSSSAQAATRAKSEFLANMSHEIRTPMTAILGFAEVLRSEDDPSKAPPARLEAIDTVIRNGNYLLELVNDILDLSKIEAGRFEVDPVPCSPIQLLAEVQELEQIRARAEHLSFQIEYDGPMPATIHTDPTRVRQILINLIDNALKFTDRGGVRLVAGLRDRQTDAAMLEFAVIDTGIGMTPSQLARIFRPFIQADTHTSRQFGGTGLGLAISRKLAHLLGGDISVTSVPECGSTFRLTIPVGSLDGVEMIEDPAGMGAATRGQPCGKAGPPAEPVPPARIRLAGRILLAEDGPDNQRLISLILQKAGAEVTAVDDGRQAVDEATRAWQADKPFDLILMDMQMPVLDGYDAVRELRQAGYRLPILALTAHAMTEDRLKCLDAGCDDYATKPIHRSALLGLVAGHLAKA